MSYLTYLLSYITFKITYLIFTQDNDVDLYSVLFIWGTSCHIWEDFLRDKLLAISLKCSHLSTDIYSKLLLNGERKMQERFKTS